MFLIWWWWTVFVEWLTDGRCSVQLYFQPEALSDVLTIPSLQHSEEYWNMCRTECKALLNESAQLWQLLHHDIIIRLITNVRQGIHFDRKNLGKEKETKWNNKETKQYNSNKKRIKSMQSFDFKSRYFSFFQSNLWCHLH